MGANSEPTGFPGGIRYSEDRAGGAVKAPGVAMSQILRVAVDVVAEQTVVISGETFRVAVVNTDSTINTAGGELNNTNPRSQVTLGAAHGLKGGDLIRVQNEIMLVEQALERSVIVKRGVSNTTIATHADALDIFKEAVPGAGGIAVGLVATLTPTAFTAALVHDINNRSKQRITALLISINYVKVFTSQSPGSAVGRPSSETIATTETLAGANNAWGAATMVEGHEGGPYMTLSHVPTANEALVGQVDLILAFTPVVVLVEVITTATRARVAWDGVVTVDGSRITLDNSGGTDWTAAETLLIHLRAA